jgi:crossover junction endodeoxyribonuclease RuvC
LKTEGTDTRIIMGIDPGSRVTGFGVIVVHQHKAQYLASGVVRAEQSDFPQRLRTIFTGLREIMETYKPTELAIEQVFMHENAGTAIKLGQARGVAIAASFLHDLEVHEYSARQIKKSIVGYGNAAKHQMQDMIMRLLSLSAAPQSDAADALACALCHYHSYQGS